MLYEEGLLSQEEITRKFKLPPPEHHQDLEEERDALRADLGETEDQLKEVEEERDTAKAELEEANEGFTNKMSELIHLISDTLEEDPEEWEVEEEDGPFATLKCGLERLIESYEALKASSVEEEVD